MKFLVAGLILITFSGAALLLRSQWERAERPPPVPAGPERVARCMVWKAERGKATVWICGTIHLLRETDYPLPEPYMQAFREAKTVVMEHERSTDGKSNAAALGMLPAGETLDKKVSPETWAALNTWCLASGTDINTMLPRKAWNASNAVTLISLQHLGFSSALGMESHFASTAGSRKIAGLETLQEQLALFDKLDARTQERMLLHALSEQKTLKARSAEMAAAWHEGDAPRLAALIDEGMKDFPEAKKLLLDDRDVSWIPKIEAYLDGAETVMILVGSGHLAGEGSVIDLLQKKGTTLTQMEYRTTRLLMPAAGNRE